MSNSNDICGALQDTGTDPLYVSKSTMVHIRKHSLLDYYGDFPVLGNRLVILDNKAPEFSSTLTGDAILRYSMDRHTASPSPRVAAYNKWQADIEATWKARPWHYRARWHANWFRLRTIELVERALMWVTAWAGWGL